jgi:hypothetical protein
LVLFFFTLSSPTLHFTLLYFTSLLATRPASHHRHHPYSHAIASALCKFLYVFFFLTQYTLSLDIKTFRETCLAGKTNLPVDVRAESQKIAVWIWTALPCTTPRPAPKSSTDDLAWDLWARRHCCRLTLVGLREGERGPAVNRLKIPNADPSPTAALRIISTDQAIAPRAKGRNPPPKGELYSVTETGLVMATQIGKFKSRRGVSLPSSSIDSTFRGLQV